jgi:hypothetical protein
MLNSALCDINISIFTRKSETNRVIGMLNSVLRNRNILHLTKLLIYKSIVKSTFKYGAEAWSTKRKHRHKLLATEMDYLRHSARISRMDRIRNETIRTKMGIKKDTGNGRTAIKMVRPRHANGGLQNC